MKNGKGQNIIEYILMMAAVIVVFLIFLNPHSGPVKNSLERTLNSTVDKIANITAQINLQPN